MTISTSSTVIESFEGMGEATWYDDVYSNFIITIQVLYIAMYH